MDLYQAGRYREAQDAFNQARLFSPTSDARIEEMIRLTNQQLTPTATPAPPSPTPSPAPSPIPMSEATPYPEFSQAYFGQTFLAVVPGKDGTAVPISRFSTQDQIGVYVEKLDERLHLAFTLRIFELDTGSIVADVTGDNVQRFGDRFVWYHNGGEAPGRFRAELYAGDVLANTFEYNVGAEPIAIPTPVVEATPEPTSAADTPTPLPAPAPQAAAPAPAPQRVAPRPLPPAPPPPPPTVAPQPTPPSPPASATLITVPGGPAALAYADSTDELFVADRSGLIWRLRHGDAALTRPYSVTGEPVGLAVDVAAGRLYIAVRGQPALLVLDSSTGQQLASVPLPVDPGDIRLDPTAGFLVVVLPQNDALQVVNVRDLQTVHVATDLPRVTGLALDEAQHTLYVSQLDGEIDAVNAMTGEVTRRWIASGVGLAGLAISNDQVFAVNSSEKVLIQGNLTTGDAMRTQLDVEPAAVGLGPISGAVYVLGADANTVLKLDGADVSRTLVGNGTPAALSELSPQTAWLRPRMLVAASDERVYIAEPESATLAITSPSE